MRKVANYGIDKIKRGMVKTSEGRSIGAVHDKSAPTGIRLILLEAMINTYNTIGYDKNKL